MADLTALKVRNLSRWNAAKLTRAGEFRAVAAYLVAKEAKEHFQREEASTGVPWPVVAVIKQRECGRDPKWLLNIAQGDPWARKSVHVPAGRGPFQSWEIAADDALVNCKPNAANNKDWTPGGMMTLLERYNGLGYANKGLPSPYVWSGTDQYQRGKYVRDGVFNPNVVDVQLGCAGLLLAMQALDPSIKLDGKTVVLPPKPPVDAKTGTSGSIVVAGGEAARQAHESGLRPWMVVLIVVAVVAVAIVAYLALRKPHERPHEREPEHEPETEKESTP